jgi:hypothetical protein
MPDASPGERIEAWFELMEAHERFTRQWFEERIEPKQDIDQVLREYYRRRFEEHESFAVAIAEGLLRRKSEAALRGNANKHGE